MRGTELGGARPPVAASLEVFLAQQECTRRAALRTVLASGTVLSAAPAQRLWVLTGARLRNLRGPTEAAVDVTFRALTDTDTLSVSIGNTRLCVLDSRLWLISVGATGELYLSGVQLACGCLGHPGCTAGRFVADLFGSATRMYRGDLIRRTSHGELEYLGRTDFQVTLRRPRIELGEIEAVLGTVDSVLAQTRARYRPPLVPPFPAQRPSWLRTRFETADAGDNVPFVVRMRGAVDTSALRLGLAELVGRNEVPRTIFPADIAFELPDMSAGTSTLENGVTTFDLQLTVTEGFAGAGLGEGPAPAGIWAEFTYAAVLFDEAAITDYAQRLVRLPRAIAVDAELAADLPLLDVDVSFERVVDAVGTESSADMPLLPVLFTCQNMSCGSIALPRLEVLDLALAQAEYDVQRTGIELFDAGGALAGRFGYATGILDAATVGLSAEPPFRILEVVPAEPTIPIRAIDIRGTREQSPTGVEQPNELITVAAEIASGAVTFTHDADAVTWLSSSRRRQGHGSDRETGSARQCRPRRAGARPHQQGFCRGAAYRGAGCARQLGVDAGSEGMN